MRKPPMLLMIDNFDSFTFNVVQYFQELGCDIQVVDNNALTIPEIEAINPEALVLSPGPGRPENAGITLKVIEHFHKTKPILGVCLGHQSIAHFFGGKIVSAQALIHGKSSRVFHRKSGLFETIPSPFSAGRYHSLIVEKTTLPDCLDVTATTAEGEIMALQHRRLPIFGVQFHPESILTEHGHQVLQNFLAVFSHHKTYTKQITRDNHGYSRRY